MSAARYWATVSAAVLLVGEAWAAETPSPKSDADAPKTNCIAQTGGYTRHGEQLGYAIALTNSCEQRYRCRVYAYAISAKGPSQGRGTLILGPKSRGKAATKVYEMRVKMDSGSMDVARECKAY
jgi:hypothetical protein